MNIFFLDTNPKICAQYHCDKHVVKMVLEYAQILCTVINEKAGTQITPYKSTHINHPCVKWAEKHYNNALYLSNLFENLSDEYTYRYNKVHKTWFDMVGANWQYLLALVFYSTDMASTSPALVMPDKYKTNNPVESYRAYYLGEKQHILKWTKRGIPEWFIESK